MITSHWISISLLILTYSTCAQNQGGNNDNKYKARDYPTYIHGGYCRPLKKYEYEIPQNLKHTGPCSSGDVTFKVFPYENKWKGRVLPWGLEIVFEKDPGCAYLSFMDAAYDVEEDSKDSKHFRKFYPVGRFLPGMPTPGPAIEDKFGSCSNFLNIVHFLPDTTCIHDMPKPTLPPCAEQEKGGEFDGEDSRKKKDCARNTEMSKVMYSGEFSTKDGRDFGKFVFYYVLDWDVYRHQGAVPKRLLFRFWPIKADKSFCGPIVKTVRVAQFDIQKKIIPEYPISELHEFRCGSAQKGQDLPASPQKDGSMFYRDDKVTTLEDVQYWVQNYYDESGFITKMETGAEGTEWAEDTRPLPTAPPSTTTPTAETTPSTEIPDPYEGCGKKKGCIVPDKECEKHKNCSFVVTHEQGDGFFKFEMMRKIKAGQESVYMAMGFSEDQAMGDDMVVECVKYKSEYVDVFRSRNLARKDDKPTTNKRLPGTQCSKRDDKVGGLKECGVVMDNTVNTMFCTFHLYKKQVSSDPEFGRRIEMDFSKDRFHILVVVGYIVSEGNIGEHSEKFVTNEPIDLRAVAAEVVPKTKMFLHVHFMLITFVIVVPNAMFVARYLKESLNEKHSHCGKRFWFLVHSSMMLTGFILAVIAFVLIVMYRNQYANTIWAATSSSEHHATLGAIILFFYLLQVTTGWIKPRVEATAHVYTTIHAAIGFATHLMSMAIIFRSGYVGMPCTIVWVYAVNLVWQVAWNIVMIIHYNWLDKMAHTRKHRAFNLGPLRVVEVEDAPGQRFRVIVTLTYFGGTVVFYLAMVLLFHLGDPCPCTRDYCKTRNL